MRQTGDTLSSIKAGIFIGAFGFAAGGIVVARLSHNESDRTNHGSLVEDQFKVISELRNKNFELAGKLKKLNSTAPLVIYGPGSTVRVVQSNGSRLYQGRPKIAVGSGGGGMESPHGQEYSKFCDEILANIDRFGWPEPKGWRRLDQEISLMPEPIELWKEGNFALSSNHEQKPSENGVDSVGTVEAGDEPLLGSEDSVDPNTVQGKYDGDSFSGEYARHLLEENASLDKADRPSTSDEVREAKRAHRKRKHNKTKNKEKDTDIVREDP